MSSETETRTDNTQPQTTTASPLAEWLCPACRGVRSTQAGNCPQCGTTLERGFLTNATESRIPELRSTTRRLWGSIIFGFPLIALGIVETAFPAKPIVSAIGRDVFLFVQVALATLLVTYCAGPYLWRAWRSVRTRRLTIDTLLGLSTAAAYLYSVAAVIYIVSGVDPLTAQSPVTNLEPELKGGVQVIAPFHHGSLDPFFETTAMLVILALIGKLLDLRARQRTLTALMTLSPLAPKTARVVQSDGTEAERDVQFIQPGELVRVRAGELIPVDGVIREGMSTIDESKLTGEALRAERGPGGRVLAGSENGLRPITVEATRVGSERVIDQVVGLVGQAQNRRSTFEQTTDRLVAWYMPAVLLVAFATFIGWTVFGPENYAYTYAAVCTVAVLVVACPCAVGLATSAATVIGMRRAAKANILFRDAASLERLRTVDTVLFDKTGTLTVGKPKFASIVPNSGSSEALVLSLAAAVERGSEHPLGLAIVWEAVRRGLQLAPAEEVEVVVGKGIRGLVNGQRVSVGRLGFLQESGVYTELMLSEARAERHRGHIVVFVGEGKRCAGMIVLNDPLRAGTIAALDQLRAANMRLILLTGDHADTANGLARSIAINEVIADALPVEKFAVVQKFKGEGRVVAMCGDGVNDAPALVAADVGIAMGSGTGAAIGTAGVTLVNSDLRDLIPARELSDAVVQTIRRNLILAFAFNVLAIPIAAGALIPFGGGLINSVWATAAMSVGSLAVLANSFRLAVRPLKRIQEQEPARNNQK